MKALLFACLLTGGTGAAHAADSAPLAETDTLFLEFLDARDAEAYLNSGHVTEYEGQKVDAWSARLRDRHLALLKSLDSLDPSKLSAEDTAAVAAIRVTLADFGDPSPAVANAPDDPECKDRNDRKLDYESLSAALSSCYREIGNQLKFENGTVDRGTALGMLSDIEEPELRKALFDAFLPLWAALNGNNEADSPYRRLIKMAAAEEATNGSGVEAAARAIGVTVTDVERWLVQILEAWRDATGPQMVEPWDYRYVNGEAQRRLAASFPDGDIVAVSNRFYLDLGADLGKLGVVNDIKDRPDKSPLAYTDFLKRGRYVNGQWQPTIARVVGRYEDGGLGSLNELVHENGHAVHISAIRNRPAYTDWTDTIFTEAFADVPSWSVYEPVWQQKYLRTELPTDVSLRALHGSVMMDIAWSLFEIRMLRDPASDPNQLWTDITREYLHVVPHPEVAWWAVRVQLVSRPGYMVNYGLGAVLTAEIRNATAEAIGPFDAGNPKWHEWSSEKMLRYGSEKSAKTLMQDLLGQPLAPDSLLDEIRRIGKPWRCKCEDDAPPPHVVRSPHVPETELAISGNFQALPVLSFPIENLTNAERHIFVAADETRRVQRTVIVQTERAQDGSDFRFLFPPTPPEQLGSHAFRFGAFAFDDVDAAKKNPEREAGLTRAHLTKLGYSLPRYWRSARLARVADPKGFTEIIVFYMESADADLTADEKAAIASDQFAELEPASASRLLADLRSHVTVVAD